MRIAIGCLIALAVAYTSVGENEESTAPCPQSACAKACAKASACDKTKAGETAMACPTAQAGKAAKNCEQAKSCETKTGETVAACAKSKDCADSSACATACAKSKECEAAKACAVAANVLNATNVSGSTCSKETACNKEPACCKQAAVATACAEKKACAHATATACAEKGACPLTAGCPEAIAASADSECAAGKCCKEQACPATAEATDQIGAPCAKLAVASDADCPGEALVEVSDCCVAGGQSTACSSSADCGMAQLTHLARAAEHLTAAGLVDEAASVRAMSVKLCQELVAQKTAQIASLQAEIAALTAGCEECCQSAVAVNGMPTAMPCRTLTAAPAVAPPRSMPQKQVALHVKVVEVSLSKLKQLGFDIMTAPAAGETGGDGANVTLGHLKAIAGLMKALERENMVKVLAEPTIVLVSGRPVTFKSGGTMAMPVVQPDKSIDTRYQEFGTQINASIMLLDEHRVRVEIRPRITQLCPALGHAANGTSIPGFVVDEIDTGFEMELGKTALLGGHVQERVRAEKDPETLEPKMVRSQVQTLFMVTPSLIEPASPVKPVNHEDPSEASAKHARTGERRIQFNHSFHVRPQAPLPKIHFRALNAEAESENLAAPVE